jgi:hypothetical protein
LVGLKHPTVIGDLNSPVGYDAGMAERRFDQQRHRDRRRQSDRSTLGVVWR